MTGPTWFVVAVPGSVCFSGANVVIPLLLREYLSCKLSSVPSLRQMRFDSKVGHVLGSHSTSTTRQGNGSLHGMQCRTLAFLAGLGREEEQLNPWTVEPEKAATPKDLGKGPGP